jgi:hypothetical protein
MHIDSPKGFCLGTSGIYIYTSGIYRYQEQGIFVIQKAFRP